MTKNPRPTRAEITDVANAIYDGTSAIMLSGETAAGKYPVESVRTMALIAMRTESDINYIERFRQNQLSGFSNVTTAISRVRTTAHDLGANAIITVTKSGNTARMISRFRPVTQIIGCSPCEKVCRQLALSWGVAPMSIEEQTTSDDLFKHAISLAVKNGFVEYGDLAVITAGLLPARRLGNDQHIKGSDRRRRSLERYRNILRKRYRLRKSLRLPRRGRGETKFPRRGEYSSFRLPRTGLSICSATRADLSARWTARTLTRLSSVRRSAYRLSSALSARRRYSRAGPP